MNQLKMPYTGPIAGVAKTIDIVDSTGVYTVPEADKGTRYLIRKSNAIADIYAIKATNAVFTRKRLTSLHFNRQDDFFLIEKGDGDEWHILDYKDSAKNAEVRDNTGKASIMVKLERMRMSDIAPWIAPGDAKDVWSPAFYRNGKLYDYVYVSKYPNTVVSGKAYSIHYADATCEINFDSAKSACTSKGAGWHLMSNVEWDFLSLWSRANGTLPKGNNYAGRDIDDTSAEGDMSYVWNRTSNWNNRAYKQVSPSSFLHVGRVFNGSGPKTWYHDHDDGVWGMNGNVWEWVDGLKIVNGVAVIRNNNDIDASEASWVNTGVNITAGLVSGQSIKTHKTGAIPGMSGAYWDCMCIPASNNIDAPAGTIANDAFWFDATSERFPLRGGCWNYGASAGTFALLLDNARSDVYVSVGFRAAFFCDL